MVAKFMPESPRSSSSSDKIQAVQKRLAACMARRAAGEAHDPRDAKLGRKLAHSMRLAYVSSKKKRSVHRDIECCVGLSSPADWLVHMQMWLHFACANHEVYRDKFVPRNQIELRHTSHSLFNRFFKARLSFNTKEVIVSSSTLFSAHYTRLLRHMKSKLGLSSEQFSELFYSDYVSRMLSAKGYLYVAVKDATGTVMFYHNDSTHFQTFLMGNDKDDEALGVNASSGVYFIQVSKAYARPSSPSKACSQTSLCALLCHNEKDRRIKRDMHKFASGVKEYPQLPECMKDLAGVLARFMIAMMIAGHPADADEKALLCQCVTILNTSCRP